jgi:phosphopantothenoylcysteine decarboxylase/phosphopantothenate--cysteine ligase
VRFIGNKSSGQMGYALAEELANRGAQVRLVSGPTSLNVNHSSIIKEDVMSAAEMYDACISHFKNADIAIMCAAVADFTPKNVTTSKIKKAKNAPEIDLVPTKDILAELGHIKSDNQLVVGFALETDNEEFNAQKKLQNKKLDFIVLNSLKDDGAGFGVSTNKVTIIDKRLRKTAYELKSKTAVAKDIVDTLVGLEE